MKTLDIKKIQPTRGYVLVEPAKAEEKTASGIILTESESEKPQHGTVLAVGACDCGYNCDCSCDCEDKSCDCNDSYTCEAPVKVGDKVIYKKWGGNDLKIDEIEYQFLKFEDILAVIK